MKQHIVNIPEGEYCKWCSYCDYNENRMSYFCWKYKQKLVTESFGTFDDAIKCLQCMIEKEE